MKKIIFILLLISIPLNLYSYNAIKEKTQTFKENNNLIIGYWGDQFPVPSQVLGNYIFLKNKIYIYYTLYEKDIKKKYYGSIGFWTIKDNKIYLKAKKQLFWQNEIWNKECSENIGIGCTPSNNNKLYAKKEKNDYWIIGSLNNITIPVEKDYPITIILKDHNNTNKKFFKLGLDNSYEAQNEIKITKKWINSLLTKKNLEN